MQASFSHFFVHSFNRICITAGFNKSSEALLFITASLLQLDVRLNIHLQEECGGKTLARIPAVVYPPGQALQSGWKSTSIWLEMSPACRAEQGSLPTRSAPVSPPSSFWREIIWLQSSCWLDQFGCKHWLRNNSSCVCVCVCVLVFPLSQNSSFLLQQVQKSS